MKQRLQKIIGRAGICSRRKAENLLKGGRVLVNGRIASIGEKADVNLDVITIDNYIIPKYSSNKVILLNKPPGIVSTCNDEFGRKTVIDLLPTFLKKGMYPIGRLDMYSRGAIILTNNGYLTLQLTHPRYHHTKTYHVLVSGNLSNQEVNEWRKGIIINSTKTKEIIVKVLNRYSNKTLLEIILTEGKNRQIRKIAEKLGNKIFDLKRVKVATIGLNGLDEGSWRELTLNEWEPLLK